jgi:glycosyltransferase involved in cell wall biosynthesis
MPEVYQSKFGDHATSHVIRLMQLQERLSCAFASAVITANPTFKKNLIGRGVPADKVAVVNNTPDSRVFNRERYPRADPCVGNRFTLVYPGTVAPRYGLAVAIRALPRLAEEISGLRLLLVGLHPTQHIAELAALAERLGVSSCVEFNPPVPTEEIPRLLAGADVGIYTAIPDPHMNIAMPTKVLEYAVMGIPIIASRLQVLEEFFDNSAILFFEPGNVDQFARCVLELFRNPGRTTQLVEAMDRTCVRTMSWSNERDVYVRVVNRLLAGRRGSLALGATDSSLPRSA